MPICGGTLCTNRIWKWKSQTSALSCSDCCLWRSLWQRQEWFPNRLEIANDPTLARVISFYDIDYQSWALIEQGKTLINCENTTFAYDNEFKEYMKVEGVVIEDIFDCVFDDGAGKFLLEKEKKYLFELFKKWDPEHLHWMKILMIIQIMMV